MARIAHSVCAVSQPQYPQRILLTPFACVRLQMNICEEGKTGMKKGASKTLIVKQCRDVRPVDSNDDHYAAQRERIAA